MHDAQQVQSKAKQWRVLAGAAVYGVAGAIALSLSSPAKGYAILACSFGGVLGVIWIARATGRSEWLAALSVIVPISIFQVFPDWFLAAGPGSIVFPDNGGVRIGDVIPLAMAGLWVLPLLVVARLSRDSLWRGAAIATVLFLATELVAPSLSLWKPAGGVHELAGVAIYVLPAEAALGAATVYALRQAAHGTWAARITAAVAVSIFYTGALALCWLLIDQARLTLSF
jgi:hypothetical protein